MAVQAQQRASQQALPRLRINAIRIPVYLVLGAYCLFSILAFGWILMISLKTTPEFLTTSPWSLPEKPQFVNYVKAWKYAKIGRYFLNTVFVSIVGASVSVLISAMASYVLSRIPFRFNRILSTYFLIGYMVPLMLSVIPIYFMLPKFGLGTGLLPLILIYIASGIPFNTFVLSSHFSTLPFELEEAAAIDGASPFRTFWQIMMPLAIPGLASVFLVNFLSLWNEFFLAFLFLRGENMTLPVGLFQLLRRAEYSASWAELFAGMIISVVPVLIVFGLLQKQFTKGLTLGALKG